jgi:hypothetical protein
MNKTQPLSKKAIDVRGGNRDLLTNVFQMLIEDSIKRGEMPFEEHVTTNSGRRGTITKRLRLTSPVPRRLRAELEKAGFFTTGMKLEICGQFFTRKKV